MSNVRAGDIAIVVSARSPENVGRIVRVLSAVRPCEIVRSPDGELHQATNEPSWLVRGPVVVQYALTGFGRELEYGVGPDRSLRPIRPTDAPDEMPRVVPVGETEGVSA